jgi:aminoglycoside phosphotransferase (APT) family kinase protein
VQVKSTVANYLKDRLGVAQVSYLEPPERFSEGWETYTYRFRLADRALLPHRFTKPLVIRIFSNKLGISRCRREYSMQRFLGRLGYPVAKMLILEKSSRYFGGPFLIREEIPGKTLLSALQSSPWKLWGQPARIARLQCRLHRLSAAAFQTRCRPLLDRSLAEMASIIQQFKWKGLEPGLQWLLDHRPGSDPKPAIVHLDFHPMNLIYGPDGSLAVLDWTEADFGDPHADLATSLMLMSTVKVGKETALGRLTTPVGRGVLLRRYLRAYRRLEPVNKRKLSYYRAWAAFRRLCRCLRCLHTVPGASEYRPSALKRVDADHLHALQEYFRDCTGISAGM